MLKELSVIRPSVRKALDRLKSVPTDIEPIFVTANFVAPDKSTGPDQSGNVAAKPKSTKKKVQ